MANQAILCVDDEIIIVMSLRQEIKNYFKERFVYETAINAEEGLKIVNQLCSEGITLILIISDWLMPGMKGDEFLEYIRNHYPGIKTILITGHAPDDTLNRLKNNGITDAILLKPWKKIELVNIINTCINDITA